MIITDQRLKTTDGDIFGWVIDDVIDRNTCQRIIAYGRPTLQTSTTLDPQVPDYRTSSNTFAHYGTNETVDELAKILCDFIEYPIENFEGMQIVHYNSGEFYKEHHDYFELDTTYYNDQMKRGGQRVWTGFIYLNDVFKGGETYFPEVDFKVKPKAGRMVLWLNTIDNIPLSNSLHEALPPIDCEKWGANIWVREKPFR
jgi:prolyl 4-hydroxylase